MHKGWRKLAAGAPAAIVAAIAALSVAAELGRLPYFELATHFRLQYACAASLAAAALRLPTFEVGGMRLYKRLTLVAEAGEIVKAFYPVFPPDRDAAAVLGWLRARLDS